jgi:hypothetical protein
MRFSDVRNLCQELDCLGIPIWVDGGWAVDALLGKQTRSHDDLDIVVEQQHLPRLCEHLRGEGYADVARDDTTPWNFVLGDDQGRQVDIHVISFFDDAGNGIYGPVENGVSFPHLSALVDKTGGEAQRLIDEKGRIPPEVKANFIAGALDYFINQTYRSLKCFRDGTPVGARLEAAEAVTPFLNGVFALHDRLRPYYKYIEWELYERPLTRFTLRSDELIHDVLDILKNGATPNLQKLLLHLEELARTDGYGGTFADWGVKLEWMKTVRF